MATTADDLDRLVPSWLTVPDVAERLGVDLRVVRGLLREGSLVGARRGEREVMSVPEDFLVPDGTRGAAPRESAAAGEDGTVAGPVAQVLASLPGTLAVLADAGFDPVESIRWLFSPDGLPVPGETPIAALRAGHTTEVRRRAQALGF